MKYDFSELNDYLSSLNLSSSIISNISHSLKEISNSSDDSVGYSLEDLHKFYLMGFLSGLDISNVFSNYEYDKIINMLNSSMSSKNLDF